MRLGPQLESKTIQIRWWNMIPRQHWMTSTELLLICFSPEILAKSQNLICFHVKGMKSGHPQPPSLKVTLTSRLKWEQEQWPWTRLFIKETKHLKKKTFEEKTFEEKKHQSNGCERGFSLIKETQTYEEKNCNGVSRGAGHGVCHEIVHRIVSIVYEF